MKVPSESTEIFERHYGSQLIRVRRYLYRPDYEKLGVGRDQLTEGSVELSFNDGSRVSLLPDSGRSGVGVIEDALPRWGGDYFLEDVSQNDFWRERLGEELSSVAYFEMAVPDERSAFQPVSEPEFAVELVFGATPPVIVEFMPDDDGLRIVSRSPTDPDAAGPSGLRMKRTEIY